MNYFNSKFGLYETLRALIPGIYSVVLLSSIVTSMTGITYGITVTDGIILAILSISLGFFIYSWDLPKKLNWYQKDLPTKVLKKEFDNLSKEEIENIYFSFYDNLSADFKRKVELYSSFHHYSVIMLVTATFILVIQIIILTIGYNVSPVHISINALIAVLSTITIKLTYNSRLKGLFKRQLIKFKESEKYNSLINKASY